MMWREKQKMYIHKLRVNHFDNPVGYTLDGLSFSWVTQDSTGSFQKFAQVQVSLDEEFSHLIYDSGKLPTSDSLDFHPDVVLTPRTRYWWRVQVWADDGDTALSDPAFFETGKLDERWKGMWITPAIACTSHPLVRKVFTIPPKDQIRQARAYVTGLGVYEFYLNGQKVGDEVLTPGYNDYDYWIQYQTYDITDLLQDGENVAGAMLGNGWYMGRFGFSSDSHPFGGQFAFLCEMAIELMDGSTVWVVTDNSWQSALGPVVESSIYDGEVFDARLEIENWNSDPAAGNWFGVHAAGLGYNKLTARWGVPVTKQETIHPISVIHTPAGETVLDFGQNLTGWMEIDCDLPAGEKLVVQCGEILQNDCFYRDNLRSAKEEYTFISAGKPAHVRPHFTFYGFRYLNVITSQEVKPENFTAYVLHSQLERTGYLKTSNEKVNQLIHNALWGQKGNFLDVPTDCPQRDERMGWTGDAQIFCGTASFNMYTPAFFSKYLYDMHFEQEFYGGSVPHVVPQMIRSHHNMVMGKDAQCHGSCAWGDAATVIPWTMYLHYGDKQMLRRQFANMCGWVNYIKEQDEKDGGHRLWRTGFHFADWLALDNPDKESRFGGTDNAYIASAYYLYSAELTAKAAQVLGEKVLYKTYRNLAEEVRSAMRKEYFTSSGRIAINTQTAMVVALFMNIVPSEHRERLVKDLRAKLESNHLHLDTGFVGTPYLCRVLSDNGSGDYAYTLLFNEDFPSWLYEVNMGATTVWERWNSVLPDGRISDTGMNSLNHYAYGSIVEWMYRNMCGLVPDEEGPGFAKVRISPQPDSRLKWAHCRYDSAVGTYKVNWAYGDNGLRLEIEVPFNAQAQVTLPWSGGYTINGKADDKQSFVLKAGCYEILQQ